MIARVLAALALLAAVLALAGCESTVTVPVATAPAAAPPGADEPPPAPREFRGAWVATVSNIDWPSQPGLSADAQRAEALAILDRARAIGLNALILQVRPAGDAIYPSALEPWSEYLTGAQGRAARAGLRPAGLLGRAGAPARARAARLVQPLPRAPFVGQDTAVAPHLALRRPDLVVRYGDQLWMDPGEHPRPPTTRWPWSPTSCAATTSTACTSTTTSTPTR